MILGGVAAASGSSRRSLGPPRSAGRCWRCAWRCCWPICGSCRRRRPCTTTVQNDLVPLALPLLLFRANVFHIVRTTGWLFVAFHLASIGTVVGAAVAASVARAARWPTRRRSPAIMTASYIGGGVNFFAVARSYGMSENVIGPLLVADNFIMAGVFLALLLDLPQPLGAAGIRIRTRPTRSTAGNWRPSIGGARRSRCSTSPRRWPWPSRSWPRPWQRHAWCPHSPVTRRSPRWRAIASCTSRPGPRWWRRRFTALWRNSWRRRNGRVPAVRVSVRDRLAGRLLAGDRTGADDVRVLPDHGRGESGGDIRLGSPVAAELGRPGAGGTLLPLRAQRTSDTMGHGQAVQWPPRRNRALFARFASR